MCSFFVESGPASSGWTVYPPLSALPKAISGSGTGMTLWLISMVLFVASSLIGALNYISTILNMRTKGMDMWKMPLTIWAFFLTAIVGVLSFPVLVSAVVLLIFDRSFGTSFYLSDIVVAGQILPNFWLPRDGLFSDWYYCIVVHCMGTPYVCNGYESFPWRGIHDYNLNYCRAFSSKDL
jgi:heme/copper-type cytochrome/quinol oxidase subunit 1